MQALQGRQNGVLVKGAMHEFKPYNTNDLPQIDGKDLKGFFSETPCLGALKFLVSASRPVFA